MILENEVLRVEFGAFAAPVSYVHKPTGRTLGCSVEGLLVNGLEVTWKACTALPQADAVVYELLGPDGLLLRFRFSLLEASLLYQLEHLTEGAQKVRTLGWKGAFVVFDRTWSYFRDRQTQRAWDNPIGRGLRDVTHEQGRADSGWPDTGPESSVHACGFAGDLCCFVHSNWPLLPLWSRLGSDSAVPGRSSFFELGLNPWQYRVRDKTTDLFRAEVVFAEDLNGDGKADENEYQLALRARLPQPLPLYREAIWYKVFCASPGRADTTFAQCLSLARRVWEVSGGCPQVMYLTGWQYDGHDTGYPALDRLNPALGTRDDLLHLIAEAKKLYRCNVSLHANLDDAYPLHPLWDPALMSLDLDGSPMPWEVFNGVQCYHLSHTKDVESGSVFRRLESMLELFPITETVHLDAFRTRNFSWEPDGFIGEAEELFCGVLPILAFLKAKGLDVTTESLNGVGFEMAGVYSGLWHHGDLLPVLYHNRVYGGARGHNPLASAAGSALNTDYRGDHLAGLSNELVDQIALDSMLYRFLLQYDLLEFRSDRKSWALARYSDGVSARGSLGPEALLVLCNQTLIADLTTRFLPFPDRIYVYSTLDTDLERLLPPTWRDKDLKVRALGGNVAAPTVHVSSGLVRLHVPARTPLLLEVNHV